MAEIHICINCEGDGFPTSDELSQHHAVQDALLEGDVGEIVDSGSGRGAMDIFIEVVDEGLASTRIVAIVERLGLTSRTKISVATLD